MRELKIYLAGKIAKGDEIGKHKDWREEYMDIFRDTPNVSFISPDNPTLDESKPVIVFGHDCDLVQKADVVVIDAPEKLGVGTAQEMVIAKYFRKVVLTVLPKGTHHRRINLEMHGRVVSDWIHPFVFAFSDEIFTEKMQVKEYIVSHIGKFDKIDKKTLSIIDDAISSFHRANLDPVKE